MWQTDTIQIQATLRKTGYARGEHSQEREGKRRTLR
jgi:hypothetical protein